MTEIRTRRLRLRRPEEEDLPAIAELIGDFAVSRMLARVPHPYGLDEAKAWYEQINRPGGEDWQIFAISLDGGAIGMIGFRNRDSEPTIGYWLGKPYWGRGYMSEACAAAVRWFFDHHAAGTLFSGVFEDNPGSLRIQEKLGFELTGSVMEDCLATGVPRLELTTRLRREVFYAQQELH